MMLLIFSQTEIISFDAGQARLTGQLWIALRNYSDIKAFMIVCLLIEPNCLLKHQALTTERSAFNRIHRDIKWSATGAGKLRFI
jgi:hypothetical protein